jgi:hypothetical protein
LAINVSLDFSELRASTIKLIGNQELRSKL